MPTPDPRRVAAVYHQGLVKTAGEVIFKKDRSGDVGSWAYADVPPSRREIPADFNYAPRHRKPLAKILRATLAGLGHTLAAYAQFAKLKSARLSPDGSLGGRGYIQNIADMRKQYMNCVEALSALSDTVYDELNAPHWALVSRQEDDGQKAEVSAIIEEAENIRKDPEEWAEQGNEPELELIEPRGVRPQMLKVPAAAVEETVASADSGSSQSDELFRTDTKVPGTMGKVGASEDSVRRVAYGWVLGAGEDRLPGGLADEKDPSDFDQAQLEAGIKVEREHTKDRATASEIAMDHLTEDPDYYKKLKKIEEGVH